MPVTSPLSSSNSKGIENPLLSPVVRIFGIAALIKSSTEGLLFTLPSESTVDILTAIAFSISAQEIFSSIHASTIFN